jgi:hypothetical protein
MKFSDQLLAVRFNRTVGRILTILLALHFFGAKGDETTVGAGAPLPGPTIPSLLPDDSYITYSYELSGTGSWDNDYDGDYGYYSMATVNQETVHYKTNGTVVESASSVWSNSKGRRFFCPPSPGTFWSSNTSCLFTNYVEVGDGDCVTGNVEWYTDSTGVLDGGLGTDIASGPTTTNVPCGTLTIGTSWYVYTPAPWRCCCNQIYDPNYCCIPPLSHHFGAGTLYQIELTITPDCASPWSPPPIPPSLFSANVESSSNPTTPSAGSFDNSGNFDFSFIGIADSDYLIFASSNLLNWTLVGTVNIATGSTNGSFSDTNVASLPERFYVVEDSSGNYSAPYGFINLSLSAGYAMIGDPLFNSTPQISSILSNVPSGTTLQFWAGTNWVQASTFSLGAWDNDALLIPGQGALIYLPTNTTLTFIGEVIQGTISNAIPQGYSVMSSAVPQAGSVAMLGLTGLSNGDTLQRLVGTNYVTCTYSTGSSPPPPSPPSPASWSPSMPTLGLCEAVLIDAGETTSWTRSFNTFLANAPVITLTNLPVSISGTTFTMTWTAVPDTASYSVLYSTNVAGPYSTILASGLTFTTTLGTYTENLRTNVENFYMVTSP